MVDLSPTQLNNAFAAPDWQTGPSPILQALLAHAFHPAAIHAAQFSGAAGQAQQGQQTGAGIGALGNLWNQYNAGGATQLSGSPMPDTAQYLGQDVGQPYMSGLLGMLGSGS